MADEQSMTVLKKRRGIIKGQLSKFITFVDKFDETKKYAGVNCEIRKGRTIVDGL